VSPLQSLKALQSLNVSENELGNLSGVAALTQLRSLDAHGNGISDFSPLSGMTQLESLILRDNGFQGNLSALSSLTKLKYLDLRINQILHVTDLRHMTNLTHLDLYDNLISDVSILGNMSKLETLLLDYNRLTDISQLTQLTHLRKLSLQVNPLQAQAYTDLRTIKNNNPNIELTYSPRNTPPSKVQATKSIGQDPALVTWEAVDNGPLYTSYYRVYRAHSQDATPMAVSDWQSAPSFSDVTAVQNVPYVYWVQTALSNTGLGSGDLSTPVQAG
jgi:hypothetical protein